MADFTSTIEQLDVEIATEDFIDGAVFCARYTKEYREAVIESDDEEGYSEHYEINVHSIHLLATGETQNIIEYLGGHIVSEIIEAVEEKANESLREARSNRGIAA